MHGRSRMTMDMGGGYTLVLLGRSRMTMDMGDGYTHVLLGRSRTTIDPRIPTLPGRRT